MQGAEKRTLWGLIDLEKKKKSQCANCGIGPSSLHTLHETRLFPIRCATTENYDRDQQWKFCQKEERPTGESVVFIYFFKPAYYGPNKGFFSRDSITVNVSYMKPYLIWLQCQILRPCFYTVKYHPRMMIYSHLFSGYCDPNPCQNGGVCEARMAGFHCTCTAGFHGRRCETGMILEL